MRRGVKMGIRKYSKTFKNIQKLSENIRKLSENIRKLTRNIQKYSKIFKNFTGTCANGVIWMCPVDNVFGCDVK